MSKQPSIYNLKLHESVKIKSGHSVTRVPGGWLYENFDEDKGVITSSTFVRFDNEFQK